MSKYDQCWVVRRHEELVKHDCDEGAGTIKTYILSEMSRGASFSLLCRELKHGGCIYIADMRLIGNAWHKVWKVMEPFLIKGCTVHFLGEGLSVNKNEHALFKWLGEVNQLEVEGVQLRNSNRELNKHRAHKRDLDRDTLRAIKKDLDDPTLSKVAVAEKHKITRSTIRSWELKGVFDNLDV